MNENICEFKKSVGLFPISINNKLGYINNEGRIVIEPQFNGDPHYYHLEKQWDFSEGLAAVKCFDEYNMGSGKWGYIDITGKFVIEPQFYEVSSFSEGLARILVGDDERAKYGYIDKSGNFKIKPHFNIASNFSEGFATVRIGSKYSSNKSGNLTNQRLKDPNNLSEGFYNIKIDDIEIDKLAPINGYIDKLGNIFFNQKLIKTYRNTLDFKEGSAIIEIDNKKDAFFDSLFNRDTRSTFGFIDKSGRIFIKPQYYKADNFSEGLAAVRCHNGKTGFIDKSGKFVIEPQFYGTGIFSDGLAAVSIGDFSVNKWGYINKSGKYVINLQFDFADDFKEGLAYVRLDNKKGYIDQSGKFVIDPQIFEHAEDFSKGLARVWIDGYYSGRWGYIDRTGKYVWKPTK